MAPGISTSPVKISTSRWNRSFSLVAQSEWVGLVLYFKSNDWFMTVIVGNLSQIAYASASSFMDTLATYRHNVGLPAASLQLENPTTSTWLRALFSSWGTGIPMIMKAMMVPSLAQIIARMDSEELSATLAYAKDPFFTSFLPLSKTAPSDIKQKLSAAEVNKIIVNILRVALELQRNMRLGMVKSLMVVEDVHWTPFFLTRYCGTVDILWSRFHYFCPV